MFAIYDKEGKGTIPIMLLHTIMSKELFTRSHWSEVETARNSDEIVGLKSAYSDGVMKNVMKEIMQEYDAD